MSEGITYYEHFQLFCTICKFFKPGYKLKLENRHSRSHSALNHLLLYHTGNFLFSQQDIMFSLFTALKIKTASMRTGKCLIISVYRKKKFSGLVWFHLSTRTIKLFFCLTIQTEHHKCLLLLALNKKAAGFCFDCISRRFFFCRYSTENAFL